uniref:sulfite exporter TauE/SafE family protein n=1 Tax=Georgenia sp. M64 TaxID=3120520 RepID=UPI00404A9494
MLTLSAGASTVLAVGALLVGLAKTAVPGAGTISVALFAAVLPAKASTGALLVLLMVGDLFALYAYRAHADLAALRRLVPTVLLGVVAGTAFLHLAGDGVVRRVIGVILLLLLAVTLWRRAREGRPGGAARTDGAGRTGTDGEPRAADETGPARRAGRAARGLRSGVYGVLAGFTTMVANAGGPVMSMYFLASRFPMRTFLGTAAWFFFAVNLAKTPFSVSLGLITGESLVLDALLAPAVVVGALLGRRLVRHMNQTLFDRLVVLLTAGSAMYLLV